MQKEYKDITFYGIIGNGETCALVGRDGSIDWMCLPYLESPSVFGALLDLDRGGALSITPVHRFESVQSYVPSTNILQTTFITPTGNTRLTDFMPVTQDDADHPLLIRKVEGVKGISWLKVAAQPRFNYGRTAAVFDPGEDGVLVKGGKERVFLQSPGGNNWKMRGETAEMDITVGEGKVYWFVLQYNARRRYDDRACQSFLQQTNKYWQDWVKNYLHQRGLFDEPWRDVVIRSGLVLKLLISPGSGAIAAAATTSLPEYSGGIRNWDYRFAWMRDSTFTIQALYHLGDIAELRGYNGWIGRIVKQANNISALRAVYPLHSEADIRETILDNFAGYRNSGPVRIGNAAVEQWQLDIYGEMVNGIYETSRYGATISPEIWTIIKDMISYVCGSWERPDNGIWEFRGNPRHFVYSKLMSWVAVDRGIRIAQAKHFDAPVQSWTKTRRDIYDAILRNGYDARRNAFVQSFGSRALDASTLLIPIMGFLPFGDSRVQGTIEAIRKDLTVEESLVYRYRNDDGLAGREGCFTLCSFWLVKALALSGKKAEAEKLFDNMLKYMNPLGLLSEEIDPATGRQLGNFPQAFSHIGLINASLYLGIMKGKKRTGPAPSGSPASPERKRAAAGKDRPERVTA